MMYMSRWHIAEENFEAAVKRFTQGPPELPEGVTMVGRWHELGTGDGFALIEANDPAVLAQYIVAWADIVDQQVHPVIDDEGMAQALSQL